MNKNKLAEEIVNRALLKEFFFVEKVEGRQLMISLIIRKWPATLEGYNKLYETISDILEKTESKRVKYGRDVIKKEVMFSNEDRGLALLKIKIVEHPLELKDFLDEERQSKEISDFNTEASHREQLSNRMPF